MRTSSTRRVMWPLRPGGLVRCSLACGALQACLVATVLLNFASDVAAQSSTTYKYDALGRLREEVRPNGSTQYTYDKAGNRTSVRPPSGGGLGTFLFVSGTHTRPGASGDIAIATIRNSGAFAISGITVTCSQSWVVNYTQPTSIAPGASASFSCRALTSGMMTTRISVASTSASNSPFWTTAF